MRILGLAIIGMVAPACSFDAGGGSGEGEGSSTTAGGTTTSTTSVSTTTIATTETSTLGDSSTAAPESSTTAPGTSSETGTPEVLEHGFVKLQLRRADGERADTFDDTVRIQIGMSYETCLFEFYAANPDYAQSGAQSDEIWGPLDAGGEGWLDRLCEVDVPELVDCAVTSFEQTLEMIPALRVNYTVSGELDGRIVAFGPLPTAAIAQCMGTEQPTVRLVNGGAVGGYDGAGTKLWEGSTFEPNYAATDDDAPIVVDVIELG